MSGKGSKQRPTDNKKFADGWERIWGNKEIIADPEHEQDRDIDILNRDIVTNPYWKYPRVWQD